MPANLLADVGTATQHLTELHGYWSSGLAALEERINESTTVYVSDSLKRTALLSALRLLEGYTATRSKDTAQRTRYTHLADLYEKWQEALDICATTTSSKMQSLKKELECSTNLLYILLSDNTSKYELSRLVNSAL